MVTKTATAAKRTTQKVVDGPVKFFIAKPHRPHGETEEVISHMVGIRKDVAYPPYVMRKLKGAYRTRVAGKGYRKDDWGPITDERYIRKWPKYDIFWLERAEETPNEYTLEFLMALFNAPHHAVEEFEVEAIDFEYSIG